MTTPHLDDEALSAALDGESTGAEAAHLSGCPQCRAQLESLAAVARVVGAPVVPAPPPQADAAIERALAVWAVDGPVPPVTETGLAESHGSSQSGGSTGLADRYRATAAGPKRWRGVAAAMAAGVVVVGGLVGLLRLTGHKGTTTSSVAGPSLSTSTAPSSGAAALPSPAAGAGGTTNAVAGRDLGQQSDPAVLAQLIRGALSSPVAPTSPGATPANRGPDSASASSVDPVAACVAPARSALGLGAGPQPPVSYRASLRWRGQAAVVIVFAPPGGQAGVVMAAGDCSLLARIPL